MRIEAGTDSQFGFASGPGADFELQPILRTGWPGLVTESETFNALGAEQSCGCRV